MQKPSNSMSEDLSFHQLLQHYVMPICRPAVPRLLENNKFKQDLFLNYINFYTLIVCHLVNFINLLLSPAANWQTSLLCFGILTLMTISFVVTCRTSPQIYKFTNAFLLIITGPALLALSEANLFFAIVVSSVAPSVTLVLYRERLPAYLNFVIQYILYNFYFMPIYRKKLRTPVENDLNIIVEQQLTANNLLYILNAAILYIAYSTSQNNGSAPSSKEGFLKSQARLLIKFSHKSRALLSNIICNLDVAQLEENEEKSKVLVTNAKVCGELILCQVDSILDVERNENGTLEMNNMPTKVTDALERVWETASEVIQTKNLFGTISIHKAVPSYLMLDQPRFTQIILNILINSTKFTERGNIGLSISWIERETITDNIFHPLPYGDEEGIGEARTTALVRPVGRGRVEDGRTVIFDTHQKKLDMGIVSQQPLASKKGILKIVITDTGSGMTDETVKEILQGYPKSLQSRSRENQPDGFNLWLTSELCQKMGGQLQVYSKLGKGTTCVICIKTEIPEVDVGEENHIVTTEELRLSSKKMRGILIGDNVLTLDAFKKYAEKSQVEIVGLAKTRNEVTEIYEREFRQGKVIQVVIVSAMTFEEAQATCEKVRQFENSRNMQACAIVILSENYTQTQLTETMDPNGNIRASSLLRTPIYFPEFKKVLSNIQTSFVVEPLEPFRPKKILIVDDDNFNLQYLGRILDMDKHEYLKAHNGKKAVEVYKEHWKEIALVLMDCQMPIMDGYEATQEMRKFQNLKRIPKVKILGVTGNIGAQYDEYCREAGMNGTIKKPFVVPDVKRVVIECLYEYQ